MSYLLNIPIELLNLVASSLSPEDLFSFSQSNKSLVSWLIHTALPLRYNVRPLPPIAQETADDPAALSRLYKVSYTSHQRAAKETPPVNPTSPGNRTFLHHAVSNSSSSALTHLLTIHTATLSILNTADTYGLTPLHLAAAISAPVTAALLSAGAAIDSQDNFGETPLFVAVEAGLEDVIRVLLEKGADMSIVEKRSGLTALQKAVMFGKKSVVEVLLEKAEGKEVGVYGMGETEEQRVYASLNEATSEGFLETLRRMLSMGINPFRGGVPAVAVISCWRNGGMGMVMRYREEEEEGDGEEEGEEEDEEEDEEEETEYEEYEEYESEYESDRDGEEVVVEERRVIVGGQEQKGDEVCGSGFEANVRKRAREESWEEEIRLEEEMRLGEKRRSEEKRMREEKMSIEEKKSWRGRKLMGIGRNRKMR